LLHLDELEVKVFVHHEVAPEQLEAVAALLGVQAAAGRAAAAAHHLPQRRLHVVHHAAAHPPAPLTPGASDLVEVGLELAVAQLIAFFVLPVAARRVLALNPVVGQMH
jgi:hypothetical protein